MHKQTERLLCFISQKRQLAPKQPKQPKQILLNLFRNQRKYYFHGELLMIINNRNEARVRICRHGLRALREGRTCSFVGFCWLCLLCLFVSSRCWIAKTSLATSALTGLTRLKQGHLGRKKSMRGK